MSNENRSIRLPLNVSISLRAGFVLAIANVLCAGLIAFAWVRTHREIKQLSVTGSARRQIRSDVIGWTAKVSAIDPDLAAAYTKLNADTTRATDYLKAKSIRPGEISVSSVGIVQRRQRDAKGNETEKIVAYELSQFIFVNGTEVDTIGAAASSITELIKDGMLIESNAPTFVYSKLADLKISMLADATKDATTRADQIARNSNAEIDSILDARMGVMQITPVNAFEISDSGQNDTTSVDKEITAVVSARFSLR